MPTMSNLDTKKTPLKVYIVSFVCFFLINLIGLIIVPRVLKAIGFDYNLWQSNPQPLIWSLVCVFVISCIAVIAITKFYPKTKERS